tara:strand:+ start:563 stop:763 length:201 start_codon:yes stop_codon:yes gene_type:complete
MKTFFPIINDDSYVIKSAKLGGKPSFVLTCKGERLGLFMFKSSAIMRAVGHKAIANGAQILTEIKP